MVVMLVCEVFSTVGSTRYSLLQACGCQCNTNIRPSSKGGNCQTLYNGRLWCYLEDINGNVYCKDARRSKNYLGTYWSHNACFTPSRTDQLCQTVSKTQGAECSHLSGTEDKEVVQCPMSQETGEEPPHTVFCSQFSLDRARKEKPRSSRVEEPGTTIKDQVTARDSQGKVWYCNKSCFYPGDRKTFQGENQPMPPVCYFPPSKVETFVRSSGPYSAKAAIDIPDKDLANSSRSGRNCTWTYRQGVWTCTFS